MAVESRAAAPALGVGVCGDARGAVRGLFCLEMGRVKGPSPLFSLLHSSLLTQTHQLSTLFPSLRKKGTQLANPVSPLLFSTAGSFVS